MPNFWLLAQHLTPKICFFLYEQAAITLAAQAGKPRSGLEVQPTKWAIVPARVKCCCPAHALQFDMQHTLLALVVGSHLALPLFLEPVDRHQT